MDPARVRPGTGGEQDLNELETVKAGREAQRPVEIAAAFDQQVHARSVDAERLAEPGTEDIGLGDLTQQRSSSAHLRPTRRGSV